MLSDRWIQHQRKQNRPQIEEKNQRLVNSNVQDYSGRSSARASTTAPRQVEQKRMTVNESQAKGATSSPASGNHSIHPRSSLVIGDSRSILPTARLNSSPENDQRDERGPTRAPKGDGFSAKGSVPISRRQSSSKLQTPPGISPSDARLDPLLQRRSGVSTKSIWVEGDVAPTKSIVNQSNIASVVIARKRNQQLQNTSRSSVHHMLVKSNPQANFSTGPINSGRPNNPPVTVNSGKREFNIFLPTQIKPLSQEQLIARVRNVYADLVVTEAKLISFHSNPARLVRALTDRDDKNAPPELSHERLRTVLAIHQDLLHQYHDFFLATQHPLACPPLKRLPSKYGMSARLWRHGIHSALELLGHLPSSSMDYMLSFIYLSYSLVTLLYETVPVFEDTWTECLGDLSRYRMAIEASNMRDRKNWANVARHWYMKASSKAPKTGRLYQSLAILARPHTVEQLFYHSKSLCISEPFSLARESILTLFEPILEKKNDAITEPHPTLDNLFIRAHGILFTGRHMEEFSQSVQMVNDHLKNSVKSSTSFRKQSYHLAIINCLALLEYGYKDNALMKHFDRSDEKSNNDDVEDNLTESSEARVTFRNAQHLSNSFLTTLLEATTLQDNDILPYIHVVLIFTFYMTQHAEAMSLIKSSFPWDSLAGRLSEIFKSDKDSFEIECENQLSKELSETTGHNVRLLPEDYELRGFTWANDYFPKSWFLNDKSEEHEKYLELRHIAALRRERIFLLALKIVKLSSLLTYKNKSFYGPGAAYRESAG